MIEQKATYTLAEYEALQYRYDQLGEKYGEAKERIEELEARVKEWMGHYKETGAQCDRAMKLLAEAQEQLKRLLS
jgi:peptidoglycan hydrolase CwlO-like protein